MSAGLPGTPGGAPGRRRRVGAISAPRWLRLLAPTRLAPPALLWPSAFALVCFVCVCEMQTRLLCKKKEKKKKGQKEKNTKDASQLAVLVFGIWFCFFVSPPLGLVLFDLVCLVLVLVFGFGFGFGFGSFGFVCPLR